MADTGAQSYVVLRAYVGKGMERDGDRQVWAGVERGEPWEPKQRYLFDPSVQ